MEIIRGGIIIKTHDGGIDNGLDPATIHIIDAKTEQPICILKTAVEHEIFGSEWADIIKLEEVPIESTKYPTEMENAKMLYEFAKLLESYTPEQRDALGKKLAKDCVADMQSRITAIKQITQTDQ